MGVVSGARGLTFPKPFFFPIDASETTAGICSFSYESSRERCSESEMAWGASVGCVIEGAIDTALEGTEDRVFEPCRCYAFVYLRPIPSSPCLPSPGGTYNRRAECITG